MHNSLLPNVPVRLMFFRNARDVYEGHAPSPATAYSVGVDLRACLDTGDSVSIPAGERCKIGTGIGIEPLQAGIAGFVYSRSGLGAKTGLAVAQGVGVIDADYRGEIIVFLLNTSKETHVVKQGDRIAQLALQPYVQPVFDVVESLTDTPRGAGGFGHTGK